MYLGVFLFSFY